MTKTDPQVSFSGLGKKPEALAEIEARRDRRRAELAEAEAAITAAEIAFQASLRSDDKFATPKAAAVRDDAVAALDYARQRLEAAEAALVEEHARIAEANRLARRAEVDARSQAVAAAAAKKYNEIVAPTAREIFADLAQTDLDIAAVNAARRDGEPYLPLTASLMAGSRFVPEEVIEVTEVHCWVYARSGDRLGPEYAGRVVRHPTKRPGASPLAIATGDLPPLPGGAFVGVHQPAPVELRLFRCRRIREAVDRGHPYDLASRVALPGIEQSAPPIWDGPDYRTDPEFVLAIARQSG